LLKGMTFLPQLVTLGNNIESTGQGWLFLIEDVQVGLGIVFIMIGLLIVLLTIPRRYHLQIRVRHGKDFKLNAGVNKQFWQQCYMELYQSELVDPPSQVKSWRFAWLENEKIEGVADLSRTIYSNRFIGVFALYIGVLRMYQNLFVDSSNTTNLLLWVLIATVDLFIVIVSIRYSSLKNEMVITNKRIIFAEEVKGISGTIGRRLFYLSDIKRDDVAGFTFLKIRKFSMRYLLLTIFTIIALVSVWEILDLFVQSVFIFTIVVLLFFVNQTHVEFTLNTKGGEFWKMRHQLSNPATYVRQFIGTDNTIVNLIMSNRLEEREIIETVQTVRSGDLNLPTTFDKKSGKKHRLDIEDLLLTGEEITFQSNVSKTVPRRKLTLFAATLIFGVWISLIFIPLAVVSEIDDSSLSAAAVEFVISLAGVAAFILIITLWVKYYSLFRASLVLTDQRIFFQDRKKPPWWTYYLGLNQETYTTEALRSEVHSTYTSRQFNQSEFWRLFIKHSFKWLFSLMVWGIIFGLWIGSEEAARRDGESIESSAIIDFLGRLDIALLVILTLLGLSVAWNASNAFVEIVRAWPKRIFNAHGIGFQIHIPFASREKTEQMRYAIWSGKSRL
ncbi:MAG: hypothetical protein IH840_18295, partial [Candidatus Heimdallarchaeota archaeon]|nr:hypothetical protein [Candidatus Heimdallarchaeota archaeon]